MNQLELIQSYQGNGTSLVTLTIATNKNALPNAISLLNAEYTSSSNIKCRL
jgi:peptide subunit release factor 1 (eRF1)